MQDMSGPCRKTTLAPQEHTPSPGPSSPSTRTRLQSSQHNTTTSQNSVTRMHTPRPIARTPTTTHHTMLPHYARAGATCETRSKFRQSSSTDQTVTSRPLHHTMRHTCAEGKARCNQLSKTKTSIYRLHHLRTGRTLRHYRISTHTARPTPTSHQHHSTLHAIRSTRPSPATTCSASHTQYQIMSIASLENDVTHTLARLCSQTADQCRAIQWRLLH